MAWNRAKIYYLRRKQAAFLSFFFKFPFLALAAFNRFVPYISSILASLLDTNSDGKTDRIDGSFQNGTSNFLNEMMIQLSPYLKLHRVEMQVSNARRTLKIMITLVTKK
ncbi:hypothetical protein E2320_009528, partial [Naja naja]